MDYLSNLLLFLLVLTGIFSEAFPRGSAEYTEEECVAECASLGRLCDSFVSSIRCGHCSPEHISWDGLCKKRAQPELQPELQLYDNVGGDIDQQIDRLAKERDELESNDVNSEVDTELVGPHGVGAQIPDNAVVQNVHHAPGHNQDRKVHDVYRAAAVEDENNTEQSEDADARGNRPLAKVPPAPAALRSDEIQKTHALHSVSSMADIYFLAVVAGCSIAGLVGLVVAGVCWYRLQKNVKAASETEYPAYGVTGPVPEKVSSPGDRKLAQSAQMYHYQHQKQQMIAMEKANGDMTKDGSDADSEEENEEGDYTVYECPGLAPTGEMEVKNPLFTEETPVTPSDPSLPPK